jgi:hypothetical protein
LGAPAGLLLAAVLAASAAAPGRAPAKRGGSEELELASGERLRGSTTGLKGGRLSFRTKSGAREVKLIEVARLVRARSVPTARRTDGIVLAGGDVLECDALQLTKGKLEVDSPRLGRPEVALARVRALFFGQRLDRVRPSLPAEPRAEVLMVTGSRTPAELRWLDRDKIGLASALGALDVKKDDVAWVFTKTAGAAAAGAGCCRVLLTSGEVLTGKDFSLADGKLGFSWEGRKVRVSWELVKAVESAGARMAHLSDLKVAAQKTDARVGPVRKPCADRCAAGGALRLAGRVRERGLGMRARSESSYRLDGKWKRFRAAIGLDSAAARASRGAVFVVRADGKKLFERKLKFSDPPVEVDVPLKGAKTLTLILEPGPGFEIGDYGNWVDARLLR